MKLTDIKEPQNFVIPVNKRGYTFKIKTKEQYNTLIQHLEEKGWKWMAGYVPTTWDYKKFREANATRITLGRDPMLGGGACIMQGNGVPCEDLILEELDFSSSATKRTTAVASDVAIKNNDGRSTCYWCNSPCKQVQSVYSIYSVCIKCGK